MERVAVRQLTVCVRTCISHTEDVRFIVFELGKFVLKFFAPDTFSASPVSKRVTTLDRSASQCQVVENVCSLES